ncbi:hypothetical protein PPYC1_11580 [Paenibacillus polymyxa]|uniref:hypothetical protein n=1 Tax=Paenibacillus polymyxa TaxID=1406 RepID=UPI0008FCDCC1|nr:hypothetical protein [Paenibacillus polymyxa]APB70964.1 hypothetical protein PPYC1_11580 [Paenibacillus polymyxa]
MKYPNYSRYQKATAYLKERYNLRWIAFGGLSMGNTEKIKNDLVRTHSLSELRSIKLNVNAQLDRYKQANVIVPVVVFILTTTFSLITSFTSAISNTYNDLFSADKINSYKAKIEMVQEGYRLNTNMVTFIMFFVLLIACFYFQRYFWVSLMNNIVCEAFDEKKSFDENVKESNKKKKVQLPNRLKL